MTELSYAVMKPLLRRRIENNLDEYFPDQDVSIKNIRRIKTVRSIVFRYVLIFPHEEKTIYLKKFHPSRRDNIQEFIGLEKYWGRLLFPKIIDFFEDECVVVQEGVRGSTMSRNILFHTDEKGLVANSGKIGEALNLLQEITAKGTRRMGDLNRQFIGEVKSSRYLDELLGSYVMFKIRRLIATIENIETRVSQIHGDPTPHNILLNGDEAYLLDYSFIDGSEFEDPLNFVIALELNKNVSFVSDTILFEMSDKFLKSFDEVGELLWSKLKIIKYAHLLNVFHRRKKNLKRIYVSWMNKKYMIKEIKRLLDVIK